MIENLYILGAGASVDGGAPLMNDFIDRAEDLLIEKKYRNQIEMDELFKTIRSLGKLHAKSKIDSNNIESVLGLFEMSELLQYPFEANQTSFKSLKSSYIRLITETIEQTMKFQILGPTEIISNGSYEKFAEIVDNKDESSAVITFNYDLGIDVALSNKGVAYKYFLNENDFGFPLLKLHGSLNWFKDNKEKVTPHYLSQFFQKRHFRSWSEEKQQGHLSFGDYITQEFPNEYSDNTPFIIAPTWNKTIYHNSISNVWKKASTCLSEAKNIYVIGYSLPESDSFFKFLFSLGTNSDTRIRRFWVINPDRKGVEQRYKDLLGPQILDRYRFFEMDFHSGLGEIKN